MALEFLTALLGVSLIAGSALKQADTSSKVRNYLSEGNKNPKRAAELKAMEYGNKKEFEVILGHPNLKNEGMYQGDLVIEEIAMKEGWLYVPNYEIDSDPNYLRSIRAPYDYIKKKEERIANLIDDLGMQIELEKIATSKNRRISAVAYKELGLRHERRDKYSCYVAIKYAMYCKGYLFHPDGCLERLEEFINIEKRGHVISFNEERQNELKRMAISENEADNILFTTLANTDVDKKDRLSVNKAIIKISRDEGWLYDWNLWHYGEELYP